MLSCRDKMFADDDELTDEQEKLIEIVEVISDSLIEDIKENRVELDYEISKDNYRTPVGFIPGASFHTLSWTVKP